MSNLLKRNKIFTAISAIGSGGADITVVANYSALPAAGTVPNEFYWCSASQGTSWLPGSVGGTYYSAGLYYSNGATWEFLDVPYQATQVEVDAGTVTNKFVTPSTFANASKWGNYLTTAAAALTYQPIGSYITGTGTSGQIGYWNGTSSQTSSANFVWDNTNTMFRVGGAAAIASTDVANFYKNQNGATSVRIYNNTNGTAASAALTISPNNGTNVTQLYHTAANWVTSGIFVAGAAQLASSAANGLNVGTFSDTQLSFWTNNTEKGRFLNTGQFLVGRTTLAQTFDIANFEKNQNDYTTVRVTNTTSNTAAGAAIFVGNATLGAYLGYNSAAYTTSNIYVAGDMTLASNVDLNIGTTAPSTNLTFWTNNTERGRFTSDGIFLVGRTTAIASGDIGNLEKNQNNVTALRIVNTTSGTAGGSMISVGNNSTAYGELMHLSAGYSSAGVFVANRIVLRSSLQLIIGTNNNDPIAFWTNNTEKARFLGTGELLIGATALGGGEFFYVRKDQNAGTIQTIANATSGTAAHSGYTATNTTSGSGGAGAIMLSMAASYTSSGIYVADTAVIGGSKAGGVNFGTTANAQVSFWTNNTKRATIDANGNNIFTNGALATNATNGFLYIPSCAGIPTGVPTSVTGGVPLVADSTNNKIYAYLGGAWTALN